MEDEFYSRYEIIDAHTHIFPDKIAEKATVSIGRFYDLSMNSRGLSERLIIHGSRVGVTKYLVCSAATTVHQVSQINNFVAEECKKHSEFYGFGTTHPHSESIEQDLKQVRELGLHGIKLHPDFQDFNADSPEAFRIYEQLEGVMPLLIHCGDSRYDRSSPERVANISKNFPKLTIQAAHFGGYQRWDEAEEYLAGCPNVYYDICSSTAFMTAERAAHLVRKYGVERCFFGTDFPMWGYRKELERFFAFGLTEEENKMILSENFKRVYNL